MNILKTIKANTLNRWMVRYMNYTSIKILKIKIDTHFKQIHNEIEDKEK